MGRCFRSDDTGCNAFADSIFKQPQQTEFGTVIASQWVGAKRRPMTGSAKQSIRQQGSKSGLLRRVAPRNDVKDTRRGFSIAHRGQRLLLQHIPVVMGPCFRGDDTDCDAFADSIFKQPQQTEFGTVIASQRVDAKRRPMTGSAKQSMGQPGSVDCFVASAPRNDVETQPRILAAQCARVVHESFAPEIRGRRECRALGAPAVLCAKIKSTQA
jgi:hypothetical protein